MRLSWYDLTSFFWLSQLGAVDLPRLFLPQFIGYFDKIIYKLKAEAMPFSILHKESTTQSK